MADGYSYVALLDVLGYRAHVNRDRQHGSLLFRDKLTAALSVLNDLNEDDIRRVAISDTVILSTSNPVGLSVLLDACVRLFVSFMAQGLLLRGGVAYSQHFQNGSVTYSHALTLAHELEHEKAIWPRILIADGAVQASRANGNDLIEGLLLRWNNVNLLNIVPAGQWKHVYSCASDMFKAIENECPEDVFVKFQLLETFLLSHPEKPRRARGFIPAPSALQASSQTLSDPSSGLAAA
jgi:hypothetical protein